jgi:hypothetical protein
MFAKGVNAFDSGDSNIERSKHERSGNINHEKSSMVMRRRMDSGAAIYKPFKIYVRKNESIWVSRQ